ncbi:MAG: protein kinase [Sandaracinaceae bacterium]|nr:protein kinase [Sandaracinaceae bacterium]
MTTSPAEQSSLRPALPFQLGRFTLCHELGAGGMATVYLSRMRLAAGLERLVALKTIHSHLAKERTFVDMFLDEAKIASLINHPNVCSVYDFGEVHDTYFLAMEYLLGEPLFDVVNAMAEREEEELRQAGPFLAARIIADACEGCTPRTRSSARRASASRSCTATSRRRTSSSPTTAR